METKLKRLIIGTSVGTFVLLIGMVLAWNIVLIKPLKEKINKAEKDYETANAIAVNLQKNYMRQARAIENQRLTAAQWAYFQTRYRGLWFDIRDDKEPTKYPGARNATWQRWMDEYVANYGLELRSELIKAADASNVIINTAVRIDAPPQLPEQVSVPPSGFMKPVTGGSLGVDITGTLPDIMHFFNRINQSTILMTVSNVKYEGFSPQIKATFSLTPYLLAVGPSAVLPEPPAAATEVKDAVAGAAGAAADAAAAAATTATANTAT